jgi:hypothetical protein
MTDFTTRADYIRSLFSTTTNENHFLVPPYYGGGNDFAGYAPGEEEEEGMDPQELHRLEYELRRRNPDLLDKLRFAMGDHNYGVLLGQLAKGAFFGAAIYAMPFIAGPAVAVRAIQRSRLKQISRRDMGIKPRYPLRPDDRY